MYDTLICGGTAWASGVLFFFFFVNAETTVVNTDPTEETRVGGILDLTGSLRVMDVGDSLYLFVLAGSFSELRCSPADIPPPSQSPGDLSSFYRLVGLTALLHPLGQG